MNALLQELMAHEHIADLQAEAAASRLASRSRRSRKAARRALRKREVR